MGWIEKFLYKSENVNAIYQNGILYSEKQGFREILSGKSQKKIVKITFRDKKNEGK